MDVGVWLRSLGLGQYEATFRDNEIDGAVLPRLTVDDPLLGARRRCRRPSTENHVSDRGAQRRTRSPAPTPLSRPRRTLRPRSGPVPVEPSAARSQ